MLARNPNDNNDSSGENFFISPFQPYHYHRQPREDYSSYSTTSSHMIQTRRPRIGSHGQIQREQQQQQQQRVDNAATFASAVSSSSSFSSPIPSSSPPTKQQRRTRRMTSPLLGVSSSPPHPAKRSRLDSLRALAPILPTLNLSLSLPAPTRNSAYRKSKRKSKATRSSIQAPLKNVRAILAKMPPLNLNRGKKAAGRQSPKTEPTAGTYGYRCPETESSNSLESIVCIGTMETNEDFMSLEPDVFNTSMRLTPLTFDDTQVPNHFRGIGNANNFHVINNHDAAMDVEGSFTPNDQNAEEEMQAEGVQSNQSQEFDGERQDFSSHMDENDTSTPLGEKIMFTHVDETDNEELSAREAPQVLIHEDENRTKFNEMLNKVVISRGAGQKSTPEMFYTSYNSTVSELSSKPVQGQGGLAIRRTSSNDSIPSLLAVHSNAEIDFIVPKAPRNETAVDDVADSVIAWGCLAALMSSPAPSPVRECKKLTPVKNLRQGEHHAQIENLDDIVSLPQLDDEEDLKRELLSLNHTDATDNCSVPSYNGLVPNLDIKFPTSPPKIKSRKAEDSALAWGVLGAILGSPAPSSVTRKCAVKRCVNLWDVGGEGAVLEVGDDMISLPHDDEQEEQTFDLVDGTDNLSIPSFHDLDPDVDDGTGIDFPTTPTKTKSRKAQDSALAWSVLGAILGSPAPLSVTKKTVNKRFNHWEDDEGNEQIPEITSQSGDDVDEVLSAPIDLNDLLGESDDGTAPAVLMESTETDSLLAWSALGMLLGSPAPKSIPKKSVKKCFNLWEKGEESEPMPEIEGQPGDHVDDDCSASIDLNELVAEPQNHVVSAETQTDSILALSALGMLLGSPAPKVVTKKYRKEPKVESMNTWVEGAADGNDVSNAVPFIFTGDESDSVIVSPWKVPLGQKSWLRCYDGSDGEDSQSLSNVPSLSATSDGEEDAPQTPVRQLIVLFENM